MGQVRINASQDVDVQVEQVRVNARATHVRLTLEQDGEVVVLQGSKDYLSWVLTRMLSRVDPDLRVTQHGRWAS